MQRSRIVVVVTALFVQLGSPGCGLPGVGCAEDSECGDGWCWDGVCAERCTDDDTCGEGQGCAADGRGCVALDDGPGSLSVTLAADLTSVAAGSEVTLSWSSSPSAEECTLFAKTPFDAEHVIVDGFSSAPAGEGIVAPTQDTDYAMRCKQGAREGEGAVHVDVLAAATLTAEPLEVNHPGGSTLSWSTNGVASCSLQGPGGYALDDVTLPTGAAPLSAPVAAGRYELRCDDEADALAEVQVEVARVVIDSVTPSALGPAAEEVTLAFTYEGPSPASCTVSDGGGTIVDADGSAAGHQLELDATTTLSVTCEGYGDGSVSASASVPRLISAFSGPPQPIPYGSIGDFTWTAETGADCTLANSAGLLSPTGVTFTEPDTYVLTCTKDGKSASASVLVPVAPAFLDGSATGTLIKEDPLAAEADVELTALVSANATSCSVSGQSDWAAPVDMGVPVANEDELVFTLRLSRSDLGPAGDGAQSYVVACVSDSEAMMSSDPVIVWWGGVGPALEDFGTSGATMVTRDVNLASAVFLDLNGPGGTTGVTRLREIGGNLSFFQSTATSTLEGFEALERVLGKVDVTETTLLELSGAGTTGLVSLQHVGGDLVIDDNPGLADVSLPALRFLGGHLWLLANDALIDVNATVEHIGGLIYVFNNPALKTLTLGALVTAGDDVIVTGPVLESIDLSSLSRVELDVELLPERVVGLELPLLTEVGGYLRTSGGMLQQLRMPALTRVDELRLGLAPALQTLEAGALEEVTSLLLLTSLPSLASVNLSALATVGDVQVEGCSMLEALPLPALTQLGGDVRVRDNAALTSLSLLAAGTIPGLVDISANPLLTSIVLPNVVDVSGDFLVVDNVALAELRATSLLSVAGMFEISGNTPVSPPPTLAVVDMRELATVGGDFIVTDTALTTFDEETADGYAPFGALAGVSGTSFTVSLNPSMPCVQPGRTWCALNPQPASYYVGENDTYICTPPCL